MVVVRGFFVLWLLVGSFFKMIQQLKNIIKMFMRCSLQLSAFHVLILNKAHVQSLLFTTFLVLHPQKETLAMLFYPKCRLHSAKIIGRRYVNHAVYKLF